MITSANPLTTLLGGQPTPPLLTHAQEISLARRVAGGLLRLGLTPGDVISIQTPNWAEWLIMHCAATKIGAEPKQKLVSWINTAIA